MRWHEIFEDSIRMNEHATAGGTGAGSIATVVSNGKSSGLFGCADFSKSIYGEPKKKKEEDTVIRRSKT